MNTKKMILVDPSEMATIQAALQYYKSNYEDLSKNHPQITETQLRKISTNNGEIEPLNDSDIDALCERINGDDIQVRVAVRLEGGLIQSAYADIDNVRVAVMDHDIEGVEETITLPDGDQICGHIEGATNDADFVAGAFSAITMQHQSNVVIYSERYGIYLGSVLGLGFWSKLDSAGQTSACTFESEQSACEFISSSNPGSFPADLQFIKIIPDQKDGTYASIEACVRAGLPGWSNTPTPTRPFNKSKP